MANNILLVGFMGTGKSTIGRKLSKCLNYQLVDTDQMIVDRAGKPIPKIFEEDGEPAFRESETQVLQDLLNCQGHIISTGGGIIGSQKNRELIQKLGYVIWLYASFEEILERTARNANRPLLNNDDPEGTIQRLLEERNPLYQEVSHLKISTEQLCFEEICMGITESASYYFSKQV
ncbi:MAG: shikimate kinase [Akkermansiaceae bacterium]